MFGSISFQFSKYLASISLSTLIAFSTGTFATTSAFAVEENAVAELAKFLKQPASERGKLADQEFAKIPLSKKDAEKVLEQLTKDYQENIKANRAEEMKNGEIAEGDLKMKFVYKTFGDKPKSGRSLYISMHGGGGAPKAVNDSQWENQKRLYQLKEGVYLVPRAPTDTWNLWHQDHIDRMFTRLIENLIALEDVDPNRVYIMGYSAGGDGVYQLAPRMADQLAAAAMMAGHPNETVPLGLRNIGFTLHMGGNDSAYNRNNIAREWKTKLEELKKEDPKGYEHYVEIHEGKGHWMDREDAVAIPWMAKFTRNPYPNKVVWKQDDVTHNRFYWLGVDKENEKGGSLVVASIEGQTIRIEKAEGISKLQLLLADQLLNLDEPIKVVSGEKVLFEGKVNRTIVDIAESLEGRGDFAAAKSAKIEVTL